MSELSDLVTFDDELLDPKNKKPRELRINQLRAKYLELRQEAAELDARSKDTAFDAGDQQRWSNLTRGCDRAKIALERLSDIDRAEMAKLMGTKSEVISPMSPFHPDNFNVNRNVGVFDASNDDGLRSRAMAAVESTEGSDDAKQSATVLLERSVNDPHLVGLESHIYSTSHPLYTSAFRKYLADPEHFRADLSSDENECFRAVNRRTRSDRMTPATWGDTEARAAMSLTAANGGVLIPQYLDPTIHLTNTGQYSQVREIANVVSITVDQWDGVTSAGVDAAWLTENSAAASDQSPTFVGPTITPQKMAAWIYGSYEMIADSSFDQVGMLMADAKNRLEAVAFVSGTGNANGQPYGLINVLSGTGPVVTGTSGASGSADFVLDDLYALDNAMGARFRPNASFLMAKPFTNTIRKSASALASQVIWAELATGVPASCIGYPVYRNEAMPYTVTSGTNDHVVLLGDFAAGYTIVDRIGSQILFEPMVRSTGSNTPTGQAGWFFYSRVGANVLTSNAFKCLRL